MRESRLLLLALALLRAALAQTALSSAQLLGQAPQYQQHNNILHFVVPEGAPNGTYLGNIHSADGQPPYLILPAPQTPESERVAALTVNLFNGNLTTNGVLDREHREQYHFVAIVKEPFAEIKCTVTVKDINDNAPMFLMPNANETNFVIEMPENQRGIRKLLPLAIDFDTPQFGIKEFRIVSGNTPTGTFQLVEHEAPARSSLNQAINPDPDLASSMLAAGADSLSPQLIQQLAQQATVLIPSQPMMQSNTQQLSPNLPPALAMANAPAIQSISSSPTKFLIDLELSQMLDRENQSSYQLVVEAIDGGQPPLLGRLMVTVNVLDVNDNDPIFTRKIYECHFREDTAKGTLLIRVQAYDADLDSNGQVSYFIKRISSSSQPVNSINSSSSDNNNFSENSSSFNGRPFSNSNISKQQQQRAQQITTTNVVGNKLAPQRQPSSGNNDFYDTTSSGMNDQSQTFRAVKQQNFGSPQQVADQPQQQSQLFEIDPFKGEIYLVHSLDYETDQMHEITIEARDHGKPSRSSQAVVKVYVIDFYDDPPKKPLIQANPSSEASRSELAANGRSTGDILEMSQNFNLVAWFASVNSSFLFVIVLVALFAVAFPLCLVKIKSRQPESDYNDTAGLTLASNNGQTKPSPNHSTSNEYSNGGNGNELNHREHLSTLSNRQQQLPPTPCTVSNVNAFPWPPQPSGSTPGCCSAIHGTLGSTLDCSPIMMPPQWSELAATPQPAYGLDFHGPYTWDYLNDWTPGYQNMMELLQNHLGSTLGGFNAEQVQMRGCQAS